MLVSAEVRKKLKFMPSSANPGQKIPKVTFTHYPPVYLLIFFARCVQHQSRPLAASTAALRQRHFAAAAGGGGGHAQQPWFGWREACGRGLGLFMSPPHQDPIGTSEGLEQRSVPEVHIWPCSQLWVGRRLIGGGCGESCDPRGCLHPPVSAEV